MVEKRDEKTMHDEMHFIVNKLNTVEKLLNEVKEHFTNISVIYYAHTKVEPSDNNKS